MTGNDGAATAALWNELARTGQFDLKSANPKAWERVRASPMASGRSTHQNRLDTIRDCDQRYGRVIDTHTADGIFVGRKYLEAGVPMVCLETALPAKFEETILEALGRPAPRPAGLEHLESLPQRVENMGTDVAALKALIAERALRA